MNETLPSSGITVGYELVARVPDIEGRPARLQEVERIPDSDRLAALDTGGVIWLTGDDGTRETPILDLRDAGVGFELVNREADLRTVAFHPDFATEGAAGYGKLYVAYSAEIDSRPEGVRVFPATAREPLFDDVVAEFTVADPADPVVDPATKRELYRVEQSVSNHNVGSLNFDPELSPGDPGYGLLFASHGDGGNDDLLRGAQDPGHPYGSFLRYDPLEGGDGAPYTPAADNPRLPGWLPEMYAIGFRNPQMFSFEDGIIWTGDVGQDTREEINLVLAGGNYGWSEREGTLASPPGSGSFDPSSDGFQYPIAEYDHDTRVGAAGVAVAGGYVYDGEAAPELDGRYTFSNFSDGRVFVIYAGADEDPLDDGRVTPDETYVPETVDLVERNGFETSFQSVVANTAGRADLRWGEDADGELLFFGKHTGEILRVVSPGTGSGPGPATEADARGVALIYEAVLDRDGAIDEAGFDFWLGQVENGFDLPTIAGFFLASDEFAEKFGAVGTLSTQELVERTYLNVSGRPGGEEGVDFWTREAETRGLSDAELVLTLANGFDPDTLAFLDAVEQGEGGGWMVA
ncbi:MAG: PQQ-dependent sugar dehydrogenase [Paracoccaceae bacterium]